MAKNVNRKNHIMHISDYRFIRLPIIYKFINPIIHITGKPLYKSVNIIFIGFNSRDNLDHGRGRITHGHNSYRAWA